MLATTSLSYLPAGLYVALQQKVDVEGTLVKYGLLSGKAAAARCACVWSAQVATLLNFNHVLCRYHLTI